jgi:alkylation response protein AidB-like acyl-CoA dehydrogenase
MILLCSRISELYDKDPKKMTIGKIALAKAECTRTCREVCQLSREAMGGNGILLEN